MWIKRTKELVEVVGERLGIGTGTDCVILILHHHGRAYDVTVRS